MPDRELSPQLLEKYKQTTIGLTKIETFAQTRIKELLNLREEEKVEEGYSERVLSSGTTIHRLKDIAKPQLESRREKCEDKIIFVLTDSEKNSVSEMKALVTGDHLPRTIYEDVLVRLAKRHIKNKEVGDKRGENRGQGNSKTFKIIDIGRRLGYKVYEKSRVVQNSKKIRETAQRLGIISEKGIIRRYSQEEVEKIVAELSGKVVQEKRSNKNASKFSLDRLTESLERMGNDSDYYINKIGRILGYNYSSMPGNLSRKIREVAVKTLKRSINEKSPHFTKEETEKIVRAYLENIQSGKKRRLINTVEKANPIEKDNKILIKEKEIDLSRLTDLETKALRILAQASKEKPIPNNLLAKSLYGDEIKLAIAKNRMSVLLSSLRNKLKEYDLVIARKNADKRMKRDKDSKYAIYYYLEKVDKAIKAKNVLEDKSKENITVKPFKENKKDGYSFRKIISLLNYKSASGTLVRELRKVASRELGRPIIEKRPHFTEEEKEKIIKRYLSKGRSSEADSNIGSVVNNEKTTIAASPANFTENKTNTALIRGREIVKNEIPVKGDIFVPPPPPHLNKQTAEILRETESSSSIGLSAVKSEEEVRNPQDIIIIDSFGKLPEAIRKVLMPGAFLKYGEPGETLLSLLTITSEKNPITKRLLFNIIYRRDIDNENYRNDIFMLDRLIGSRRGEIKAKGLVIKDKTVVIDDKGSKESVCWLTAKAVKQTNPPIETRAEVLKPVNITEGALPVKIDCIPVTTIFAKTDPLKRTNFPEKPTDKASNSENNPDSLVALTESEVYVAVKELLRTERENKALLNTLGVNVKPLYTEEISRLMNRVRGDFGNKKKSNASDFEKRNIISALNKFKEFAKDRKKYVNLRTRPVQVLLSCFDSAKIENGFWEKLFPTEEKANSG
jgi:hypothetical protein